ncbi:MAG: hypothetical protein ABFD92_16650 [Planctomycetaceae bacterium]|nr:hypothetical protein [Planctomycetaceae bacterium]
MSLALNAIRKEMAATRPYITTAGDYAWGRFSGLSLAAFLIDCNHPETGHCPDCAAALPADGSCCDACGWVLSSDGLKRRTQPKP